MAGSSSLGGRFRTVTHSAESAAANQLARSLGCRVIDRLWPAWTEADTREALIRWAALLEDRRAYLGRPLRVSLADQRSDWADVERQLRVPLAHLAYNAALWKLGQPATQAIADQ